MDNIDEVRNCFIEETDHNELMSKKHKKFMRLLVILRTYLSYDSLVRISTRNTSFTIGLKIYAIVAQLKILSQ